MQLLGKLLDLEKENGADINYLETLPSAISFLVGQGRLSTMMKRVATHIISPISATPKLSNDNTVWSVKQTALAAQQFMLAAASLGLTTSPMEGFDERRLAYQFGIPRNRYTVPLVISVGYSASVDKQHEAGKDSATFSEINKKTTKRKVRFNLDDIVTFC